jgi:hypothetical protein
MHTWYRKLDLVEGLSTLSGRRFTPLACKSLGGRDVAMIDYERSLALAQKMGYRYDPSSYLWSGFPSFTWDRPTFSSLAHGILDMSILLYISEAFVPASLLKRG